MGRNLILYSMYITLRAREAPCVERGGGCTCKACLAPLTPPPSVFLKSGCEANLPDMKSRCRADRSLARCRCDPRKRSHSRAKPGGRTRTCSDIIDKKYWNFAAAGYQISVTSVRGSFVAESVRLLSTRTGVIAPTGQGPGLRGSADASEADDSTRPARVRSPVRKRTGFTAGSRLETGCGLFQA